MSNQTQVIEAKGFHFKKRISEKKFFMILTYCVQDTKKPDYNTI